MTEKATTEKGLLQICHGKLIPEYSSAYALRCVRFLKRWPHRQVISVGGLIFKDQSSGMISQYRSIILTGYAILLRNRSLEILISKGTFMRNKYRRVLNDAVEKSDIIVLEGPWQYPLIKDKIDHQLLIYDAHNVESVLRVDNKWESYVKDLEQELCQQADLVLTVSESDTSEFANKFEVPISKIKTIPEGFVKNEIPWKGIGSNELIFIGSAYLPNITAAKKLIEMATELPQFKFKIVGTVCSALRKRDLPTNVTLMGILNEVQKSQELSCSLLALNPVEFGSGRNLKINDYVSHGVPLITTEIGSRGFEPELRDLFFIEAVNKFNEKIIEISKSEKTLALRSAEMRKYAEKNNYSMTQDTAYEVISNLKKRS